MKNIHHEAKELTHKYKQSLLVTMLYIGLYVSLRDLISQYLGVLGLMILIATLSIEHGKVKVGLDVSKQNMFIPQQEAMIGIKKYKSLFSTYLWMKIIMFVFIFIGLISIFFFFEPYFLSLLSTIESELAYGIDATLTHMYGLVLLIGEASFVLSELIFNIFFFSAPYLHEEKNIIGHRAIIEAFKLQKGHFKSIIQCLLPYYGYMIIFTCIRFLAGTYINQIIILSFVDIIITLLSILMYESEYEVCKALIYNKLEEEKRNDYFNF